VGLATSGMVFGSSMTSLTIYQAMVLEDVELVSIYVAEIIAPPSPIPQPYSLTKNQPAFTANRIFFSRCWNTASPRAFTPSVRIVEATSWSVSVRGNPSQRSSHS
jgi:hypothetical protein